MVLTDLESTNGTRVNGEDIQLRILRFGDLIAVGRSVLLYGTREQIMSRLAELKSGDSAAENGGSDSEEFDLNWGNASDLHTTLHALRPPELPDRMSPGQAAQLVELIEYFHIRVRNLVRSTVPESESERQSVDQREWQQLLDLQSRLAEYLREIGNPNSST
jgi:pSer/pThr/pTyr-binding forkhead associated (FHA) protein